MEDPQGSTPSRRPDQSLFEALPGVLSDFAPLALVLLDEDLRVLWMSESARQAPRVVTDDPIGRSLGEVITPGIMTDELSKVLTTGLDRRIDTLVTLGDGRQRELVVEEHQCDGSEVTQDRGQRRHQRLRGSRRRRRSLRILHAPAP